MRWLVLVLILLASAGCQAVSSDPPRLAIGQECRMMGAAGERQMAGADLESVRAIMKAAIAEDNYGIGELVVAKRVYFIQAGTRCLVLDNSNDGYTQVRILDSPQQGAAVWVPYNFIIAAPRTPKA